MIRWFRLSRASVGLAAGLFLLGSEPLLAQVATTGRVIGVVQDESGAVLPGVQVELQGENVMGVQSFTTDAQGQFRFSSIPPGLYEVKFDLQGFGAVQRTGVRVRVGATTEENVTMKVGGIAEAVTVEASVAVVDTASAKVESTYDRDWIDNSPNQRRSFFDILVSAPGVQPTNAQDPQMTSFGSNVDQNLYQLDGVNVSDHLNGNADTIVNPSVDTIEQIEILSLGAPAEYGSQEGAVFNVVTRQGTNKYRGGAAYYYQSDDLTGRNTDESVDGGNPYTRIKYNNFTAQLGGPIMKDKLWFFTAYEYLEDAFAVPTVEAGAGSVTKRDHFLGKLNFQLAPGHQLAGIANYDKFSEAEGLLPGQAPETERGRDSGVLTTSLTYTGTLGPNRVLEAQYAGFFGDNDCCGAFGKQVRGATRFENRNTGEVTGGPVGWYTWHIDRSSVSVKLTQHADDFLNATHDFKLGVQYSNAPGSGEYQPSDIVYTYDFQTGYGYDYTPYAYGGTVRTLGVFLDDSVEIGKRVRLNVGVRYDHTKAKFTDQPVLDQLGNPTSQTVPGFDVYTWSKVSPRVGLNVQLTGDGRTVLKTHYGLYYRPGSTGEWVAFTSPTRVDSYVGDYNFATSMFENLEINGSPANASVDPDFQPGYTHQFTASLERQLFTTLNVAATVLIKRGRNMSNWRDVGGIYAPVPYTDSVGAEASGDTFDVFQLQNERADRAFLLTTGRDTISDVNALSLSATRRMSSNWQLTASLTLQDTRNANTFGSSAILNFRSFGQDPNAYVNSDGLALRDRPVTVKAQFLHTGLPWGLTFGVDWAYFTGYPTRRQVRVAATGLNSAVQTQPYSDDQRFPCQNLLNLRLQKDFRFGESARLSLIANAFNLFNDDAVIGFRSDLATSQVYHVPSNVIAPRRLMLGAKFQF